MRHFQPFATEYSPQNALWLGQSARLAYRDATTIQHAVQYWEFDRFEFFDRGHTQGYMLGSSELIVLAFRGTQMRAMRDWMTDVRIAMVKGCGGYVHRGFSEALDQIWADVFATLRSWQAPQQAILATGHSLGAALATIASVRLIECDRAVQGVYTYGSPRVGDRAFADCFARHFENRAFRFVNDHDLITRLPPRLLGYQHVGTPLYFDAAGVLHKDICYWEKFVTTVQGGMDEILGAIADAITDHDVEEYSRQLQISAQPVEHISTRVGTEG